jgi:hypothetical protein
MSTFQEARTIKGETNYQAAAPSTVILTSSLVGGQQGPAAGVFIDGQVLEIHQNLDGQAE